MDSFLSGFSRGYTGSVGTGYTGGVSGAGTAGSGTSGGQSADVSQLKAGDTFQGEITSVNGEDVQIQLANGQYMAAKLERDVQVALGQILNLQVQSNKDNRVVLKPVYDGNSQMVRVGEAALRAANMAVNERNLQLVAKLIENGMSIDKNTLMTYNRLSFQNPNVNLSNIIELNKLQMPITEDNVRQLQNYHNLEHKIIDGVRDAAEELVKTYEQIIGEGAQEGPALTNGAKFMEQVLTLLSDGSTEEGAVTAKTDQNDAAVNPENGETVKAGATAETIEENGKPVNAENSDNSAINANNDHEAAGKIQEKAQENIQQDTKQPVDNKMTNSVNENIKEEPTLKQPQTADGGAATESANREAVKEFAGQLKAETPEHVPDKVIQYISSGKADIKDIKQLLTDTDIGKTLTAEQKAKIFNSEPFKSLLKDGLQKRWSITPEEIAREGKVEELYNKLLKESNQLTKLMNEAMQSADAHTANAPAAKAMGNISENVEFINQMNQMFNYVQLPLKFGDSQAHGDLYVYTNKKNMAHKDGTLTAFLHLDMDHLGSLDVSIVLQTERNKITTKFYLDEDSIALVEEHIEELSARLQKKGYSCKNMILKKDEEKTVLEHIEEQVAAGSAVLSYQTFDTRA
ncbi:MAG: flagellar hook-length control protein FliK [Lachnospiraceae bacterium]|nr:flagellar hook-length control protein FliK [Lachnospiraceae bacterium]